MELALIATDVKSMNACPAVGPMNPNQAAAQALKLAFNNDHVCPPQIATPHLSIQKMRELVVNAKQSSDYTPIIRTFGSVFSEPEFLNVSFLKVRRGLSAPPSGGHFYILLFCFYVFFKTIVYVSVGFFYNRPATTLLLRHRKAQVITQPPVSHVAWNI
jgi:hypothetical protein